MYTSDTENYLVSQCHHDSAWSNHKPKTDGFAARLASADVETIATGKQIRELERFVKSYGQGRWRKLKGFAAVRLVDGAIRTAEVHWYEAHGIGRRDLKLKLPFLD